MLKMFDCLLFAWPKRKNMMFVRGHVSPNCSDTILFLCFSPRCWDPSPSRFTQKNNMPIYHSKFDDTYMAHLVTRELQNFPLKIIEMEPCRVSSWHHFCCQEEPGSPRHKMRRLDEEISQRLGWQAMSQGSGIFPLFPHGTLPRN